MNKFLTIKQASIELGLPESVIRNLCRSEAGKRAAHKFNNSLTAPYYIDIDEMLKVIRSGKADK